MLSNVQKGLEVRGRIAIGPASPAYVVAEIGTNHNRSLDTAKELVAADVDALVLNDVPSAVPAVRAGW